MAVFYWLIESPDNTLGVERQDDEYGNEIVSNDETTFILCPRCVKKMHPGEFKDNRFICHKFGTVLIRAYQTIDEQDLLAEYGMDTRRTADGG